MLSVSMCTVQYMFVSYSLFSFIFLSFSLDKLGMKESHVEELKD